MEEVTLRAVRRAMPGHGRARIHSSLLTILGIADNEEVVIMASGGTSLTLTVFADSLVEKGQIRISEEDLRTLGVSDGEDVTVRRRVPVGEQVKAAATDVAERVTRGAKDLGDSVSDKTSGLREGTARAAHDISSKAKEVSAKIADDVAPVGEKISRAGKDTAARIHDLIPTARFNAPVVAALKKLSEEDAAELKKVLLASMGEIHVAPVSPAASGRKIGNLTVPPGVIIETVQRGGARITPDPETVLLTGDLVYMTGDLKGLDYMTTVLEG